MFHFKSLLILSAILCTDPVEAWAQSRGGGDFTQRAERRQSQRWTLQEWLAQKDRNRLMDVWLSMNSPSPYELMLGISYTSYELEDSSVSPTTSSYTSYQGSFAAYAQFVGLSVEYENNNAEKFNDISGLFNLRLLGSSIQGSYLALHYGLRTHTQNSSQTGQEVRLGQQFAQASLQMYVIKHFGFDGLYRQYLPTTENSLGEVKGQLTEAGAFIDFQNFRIFGSWYKEVQKENNNTTPREKTRTGIRSGLKIFF